MGISRTAVWKQLNRLAELGIEVESVKGQGYRVPGGLDLLDANRVREQLKPASSNLLREVRVLESVDSTNAEVLRQLVDGSDPRGLVCTAERQTAGRGRRGRQWVSPFARNIYLSLAWDFSEGASALEGLSLAIGVAAVRALKELNLGPVSLKWPNDILVEGAKLGGVLLEMSGDAAGQIQVVIGLGLNVSMSAATGSAIDQSWTDLDRVSGGRTPPRNHLLAALLDELLPLLQNFDREGFSPWRDEWRALDALADAQVLLHSGPDQFAGIARGVDDRGALLLETASGIRPVFGGEVSLRPAS